jgi:hypothetical protein
MALCKLCCRHCHNSLPSINPVVLKMSGHVGVVQQFWCIHSLVLNYIKNSKTCRKCIRHNVFYLLFKFHLKYLHCNKYSVQYTEDSCRKTCTVNEIQAYCTIFLNFLSVIQPLPEYKMTLHIK